MYAAAAAANILRRNSTKPQRRAPPTTIPVPTRNGSGLQILKHKSLSNMCVFLISRTQLAQLTNCFRWSRMLMKATVAKMDRMCPTGPKRKRPTTVTAVTEHASTQSL